jgi:hypothetical protein
MKRRELCINLPASLHKAEKGGIGVGIFGSEKKIPMSRIRWRPHLPKRPSAMQAPITSSSIMAWHRTNVDVRTKRKVPVDVGSCRRPTSFRSLHYLAHFLVVLYLEPMTQSGPSHERRYLLAEFHAAQCKTALETAAVEC